MLPQWLHFELQVTQGNSLVDIQRIWLAPQTPKRNEKKERGQVIENSRNEYNW